MALSPDAQIRYELKRARYHADKKEYEQLRKKFTTKSGFSWSMLIHYFCLTYGWELDYVLSLTLRRIRLLLKGSEQYNHVIAERQREEAKKEDSKQQTDSRPLKENKTSPITSAKQLLQSGLLNFKGKGK